MKYIFLADRFYSDYAHCDELTKKAIDLLFKFICVFVGLILPSHYAQTSATTTHFGLMKPIVAGLITPRQ